MSGSDKELSIPERPPELPDAHDDSPPRDEMPQDRSASRSARRGGRHISSQYAQDILRHVESQNKVLETRQMWEQKQREDKAAADRRRVAHRRVASVPRREGGVRNALDVADRNVNVHEEDREKEARAKAEVALKPDRWRPDKFYTEVTGENLPYVDIQAIRGRPIGLSDSDDEFASSSSSSESDSDDERRRKKRKRSKHSSRKHRRRRKEGSSDSSRSERKRARKKRRKDKERAREREGDRD